MRKVRCAIYTRKSSDEGLEQEFNSLHAQREACAAFISSQKHEGWELLPDHYDDGGVSGGTLERSGLQKLLQDVDEGLVDQIVVYKIDRLTRSLADFAKLVDRLDAADASFVSVTQSFNTATSMGRLTLNVLLSFAQFEREVTAERIRDKITASKKKGLWMGGNVPLGYEADGRTLKVVEDEARTVRKLFDLYLAFGTIKDVMREAARLGLRTKARTKQSDAGTTGQSQEPSQGSQEAKDMPCSAGTRNMEGGNEFNRGHVHYILTSPVYVGRIRHKDRTYEGQHPAIIDIAIWDEVQSRLKSNARRRRGKGNTGSTQSLLAGKLFDETRDHLTPSHANKRGRRYRYYVSNRLIVPADQERTDISPGWRLPAKALEDQLAQAVLSQLKDGLAADLLINPTAERIMSIQASLDRIAADDRKHGQALLDCINKAAIEPGQIRIELDRDCVAEAVSVCADEIAQQAMSFSLDFQFRKRGVETKLVIGTGSAAPDPTLIRNLANAHRYYAAIKQGRTFDELEVREGLSRRRIIQLIDLAFLAPDITASILRGEQPVGITTHWLEQNPMPSEWRTQREIAEGL